jgi:hypothetical protein
MSLSDGPFDELDETLWPPRLRDPLQLDDGTVERLLDGLPVDDAPPRYRGVAQLLNMLNAAPTEAELRGGQHAVERMAGGPRYFPSPRVVAAPRHVASSPGPRPRSAANRRLRRGGAALIGTATLFVGLGAAGALPGAVQGVASEVLATVGVDAPNPDAQPGLEPAPASSDTDAPGAVDPGGATDGAATSDSGGVAESPPASGADSPAGGEQAVDPTEGEPQTGSPPDEPPAQADDPNGGVGTGKGKGDGKSDLDHARDGNENPKGQPGDGTADTGNAQNVR